ncbi:MAG: hypothetical protein U5N56_08730 [Candidatus Marinimicrobia bacterium]|nr:hypothetical protein [Candidatus Neomarinimicrobiota bacterium]
MPVSFQIDEKGEENIVLISEIVGERCTYVIHGKKVEKFGDDSVNYFGAGGDFLEISHVRKDPK